MLLTTLSYFDPSPTCFFLPPKKTMKKSLGILSVQDEARELNEDIFETIYFAACEASCELAQLQGSYQTYAGGDWVVMGGRGGFRKSCGKWGDEWWEPDPVQNFKRSMVPLVPIWVWYCVHNLPLKKGDFPDVRGRPGSPASKGQLQFDLWSLGRFSTWKTGTTGKDFLTGWTSQRDNQVKRYLHHPKQLPK